MELPLVLGAVELPVVELHAVAGAVELPVVADVVELPVVADADNSAELECSLESGQSTGLRSPC